MAIVHVESPPAWELSQVQSRCSRSLPWGKSHMLKALSDWSCGTTHYRVIVNLVGWWPNWLLVKALRGLILRLLRTRLRRKRVLLLLRWVAITLLE